MNVKPYQNFKTLIMNEENVCVGAENTADDSVYMVPDNHPLIELSDDEDSVVQSSVLTSCKTSANKPVARETFRVKKERIDKVAEVPNSCLSESNRKRKFGEMKSGLVNVNSQTKKIKTKNCDSKFVKQEKSDVKIEGMLADIKTKRKTEKSATASKIKSEKKSIKSDRKPKLENLKEAALLPKSKQSPETSTASYKECKLGSGVEWESLMLANWANIDQTIAKNIIHMLKNDCTIPFITRYRREKTNSMDADTLRRVKECYENVKVLETKTLNAIKQIKKLDKLTPKLENCFYSIQSLDELDFLYAPFKKGSSKSKAERARALGLESVALAVLEGRKRFIVGDYVDPTKEGLRNDEQVVQGIENIIADIFSKDEDVLNHLHNIEKQVHITIKSTKVRLAASKKSSKEEKTKGNADADPERKFEMYYDFQNTVRNILPHQVLALNRGENLKVLSVKLITNDWLKNKLRWFCEQKWLYRASSDPLRHRILTESFADSYERLICPFVLRRARSELNRKAQHAAVESFALNLKNLLQAPPIKGCTILGIDPGLKHGFKFALISGSGDVLWTAVFHFEANYTSKTDEKYLACIRDKLILYKCELVAIGNGTGCRIIEKKISECLKKGFFEPNSNVRYTIVNERGASIYSCSGVAKEEFPHLDPNLVSAVFIARSLQDPLNEFVKVEPKHIGVGMYQHDIPEKQLNAALEEIVQQCVSFTGVDINTASIHLLKRIAGLGGQRASNIIEWRQKNGPFVNRHQLTLVNQIGPKTFEQCSGFIRIHPQTAITGSEGCSKSNANPNTMKKRKLADKYNPLDRTWIHPESYDVARSFTRICAVNPEDLGTADFIDRVKNVVQTIGVAGIASQLDQTENTVSFIAEALMKPSDYDYRCEFSKPVFRQGITDMNSITPGLVMTGVISNVTNFGAFVDIGVGRDGLVHNSNANGITVQVGYRVEVKILAVEAERSRISLSLLRVLH